MASKYKRHFPHRAEGRRRREMERDAKSSPSVPNRPPSAATEYEPAEDEPRHHGERDPGANLLRREEARANEVRTERDRIASAFSEAIDNARREARRDPERIAVSGGEGPGRGSGANGQSVVATNEGVSEGRTRGLPTIGPVPIQPSLESFGLSESAVENLPKMWFDLRVLESGGPKTNIFLVYGVMYIVSFFLIFDRNFHFNLSYIVGFFAFFFIFTIPFMMLLGIVGPIEKTLYGLFNAEFRRYCLYRRACEVYEQNKREYDQRIAKRQEEYWRALSGMAFESELGKLFSLMGYAVTLTPSTGDGGVDLILHMDGKRTVVQCKAHKKRISISVARELATSMRDFQADEAIIACFEGATKPVHEYIKNRQISVLDLKAIVALQREHG